MDKTSKILSLIDRLDQLLINLLNDLDKLSWEKRTTAGDWSVKDITAHLIDGNIRSLSMIEHNYFGASPREDENLIDFLNRLNSEWVKAMKRVSPQLLLLWLKTTGDSYRSMLKQLDPNAKALFSVAWAGEQQSTNAFHIEREYTEKWHHQQQIREALGDTSTLLAEDFYFPFLETSIKALPFHYRDIVPEKDGKILVKFHGNTNVDFAVSFLKGTWMLENITDIETLCEIHFPLVEAWKVFVKGLSVTEALQMAQIAGNIPLGEHFFSILAVMAKR